MKKFTGKLLFLVALVVSSFSLAKDTSSTMRDYKRRLADDGSKLIVLGRGHLWGEKVYKISVKNVNLINSQSRKRKLEKEVTFFISEKALLDSLSSKDNDFGRDLSRLGNLDSQKDLFVWTLPVSEILDEYDSLASSDVPTYRSHAFAGQWKWIREDGCFDNYVFNDLMEFTLIHGNSIVSGRYEILDSSEDSSLFRVRLNLQERIPGDISCGSTWMSESPLGKVIVVVSLDESKGSMEIRYEERSDNTLGPFYKQ